MEFGVLACRKLLECWNNGMLESWLDGELNQHISSQME